MSASVAKPKALLLFEALGVLPDPEAFSATGLPVIEDLSQSLGAYRGETKAGGIGQLAILGLESGGLVTAGGGALLFARNRREGTVLRNLHESVEPELRMTDYNAALGFAQLKRARVQHREAARALWASCPVPCEDQAQAPFPGRGGRARFLGLSRGL